MGSTPRILIAATAAFTAVAGPVTAQVGENLGLVNPNLASSAELSAVPGLTGAAVSAIEAGRPFLRMADFHAVVAQHAPEDAFESIYRAMWLTIDLNDVTDDEILLIPGVGNRMLHEFEEYRPYVALRQFEREIGKYVDDDEVARMEQYVFVPIDLNTASEEDILSLPGVGNRMAHEFDEYRPWKSLAQFRREIGKYVDDDEVARLERFVVINP